MQMRDVLGAIYDDASFVSLFATRGRPAETPWRLALVTVMQFAEDLSDRQAAEAVRARIDWKYALGLDLTDAGFDFSVLSEFRARLVNGATEHLLLDTLLTQCAQRGYLKGRGQQRTDATQRLHENGLLRYPLALLASPRPLFAIERMCRNGEAAHHFLPLAPVPLDFIRSHEINVTGKRRGELAVPHLMDEGVSLHPKPFRRFCKCEHFCVSDLHVHNDTPNAQDLLTIIPRSMYHCKCQQTC